MAPSGNRRQPKLSPLIDGPGLPWALEANPNPLVPGDVDPSEKNPTNPRYTKVRCHAVAVAVSDLCESYSYTLKHEDAMSIVTNPRYFDREDLTKGEALEGFYYQKLYNALFLKSPPNVEPAIDGKRKLADLEAEAQQLKEQIEREHQEKQEERAAEGKGKGKQPRTNPKYEATRDEKARNGACKRDRYKCVMQETPNPEMAHLFPFAATRTLIAVIKTRKCFLVTKYAFGKVFYKSYLPFVSTLGGCEYLWNLLGLNVQLHSWLDMGFLGFRFLLDSPRQAEDKWYATIVFYWLPHCPPPPNTNRTAPAILDGGANDSVRRLFRYLHNAETNQFPPRRPENGDGVYKLLYQDGRQIRSGHSVEIAHETKAARDNFVNMIYLQWFGLKGCTFWGVTKGENKPLPISTSTALITRPAPSPGGPSQAGRAREPQRSRSTDPSPTTPTSGQAFSFSRAPRMLGGPAPQQPAQPDNAQRGRGGAQRGRGDPQRGRGGGTGRG